MKKKYLLSSTIYPIFSAALLFVTIFLFLSCNQQKKYSADWVNLTIRFKEKTSQEVREASLNAIEKFLIDTISQIRSGKYKNFNPAIVRINNPFKDSLTYFLSVGARTQSGRPIPLPPGAYALADSLPPPCLCKTDCKICKTLNFVNVTPSVTIPGFLAGENIYSIETNSDPLNNGVDEKNQDH